MTAIYVYAFKYIRKHTDVLAVSSGVGGRDGEDSRLEDSRQAHDLSALDEQYQAGLRLNQLAQQRIAQQLLGASGRPVVVDMG